MLNVEQQQHQGMRPRDAERGRIGAVRCHAQGLKLEHRIEANDASRECDEDHHCPRHTFLHGVQQDVEGQGREDKEGPIQQVGDDAQADNSGIRENVPSRRRRVAGNIHLRIHKAFGKATEDADEQVQESRDSREPFGSIHDFSFSCIRACVTVSAAAGTAISHGERTMVDMS